MYTMHRKNFFRVICSLIIIGGITKMTAGAQELQARVTVTAQKVSTQIDKKVFMTD